MAAHKFHVGQKIFVSSGMSDSHTPHGAYEIVRLLPTDENGNLYWVKSTTDGHEQAAGESQLDRDWRRAVEALAQSLYEASDHSGTPWSRRDLVIRGAWIVAARKLLPEV